MESKKRKAGTLSDIDLAEKRLKILHDRMLPSTPHIISMPKKHQIQVQYHNENRNTHGFGSQAEFEVLQYMTLITPTNGERGSLIETRGNWEEEIAALGAENGSRSNSGTPAPVKTFKNKISLSAYKKNGMKAPPSATGTPDVNAMPGHSRTTSGVSLSATSMSRGPSFENYHDARTNGGTTEREASKDIPRSSAPQNSEHPKPAFPAKPNGTISSTKPSMNGNTKPPSHAIKDPRYEPERPRVSNDIRKDLTPTTNGTPSSLHKNPAPRSDATRSLEKSHVPQRKDQDRAKDAHTPINGSQKSSRELLNEKTTNSNVARNKNYDDRGRPVESAPRRSSPAPNRNSERPGQPNRRVDTPNESSDRRTKIEHARASSQTRTPTTSHSTLPKKPSTLPPKPSVSNLKSTKPTSLGPMLGVGRGKLSTPKQSSSRPDMPRDIPPLLSPLRPTRENSPLPDLASSASQRGSSTNKKIPPKINIDHRSQGPTSAPKRKADEDSGAFEKKRPRRSVTPERTFKPLPPLLSPSLPPNVDRALGEMKEDKKKIATVEERHEHARRPDAKGVARKTPKVRGARAQKRKTKDPMSDSEAYEEEEVDEKPSRVVKLKYRKSMAKTIERMLKLTPKPDKPLIRISAAPKTEESSEEDVPLAKSLTAQKRPSASTTRPEADRKKAAEAQVPLKSKSITVSSVKVNEKARHDSPPATTMNNKDLLATPKKGDAMKSVAMRRVDSAEGQSRTPQPMATNTPTSVARSTASEVRAPSAEAEKLRGVQKKCGELALSAKRKMDEILRHKERPRPEIEPKDQKLGLATGIEATIMYIYSNTINTKVHELSGTHVAHRLESCNNVLPLIAWITRESRNLPVMHALALHISAIAKEYYERELVDAVTRNPKEPETLKALINNSTSRTNDWLEAEKIKDVLVTPGGATFIGPGMDIKTITDYTLGVLTAFSRTEKTGWKKDPAFGALLKGLSG